MPESMISALKTPEDLLAFFTREFADSIPLIGEKKLIKDFFANPKTALMSIKVPHPPNSTHPVHSVPLQRQSPHRR